MNNNKSLSNRIFPKAIFRFLRLRLALVLMAGLITTSQAWSQSASPSPHSAGNMDQQFRTPPREAQPWVFWMWLRADTTPAAITKDLEEMKAKGIAGVILYDSGPGGNMGPQTQARMILKGKEYVKTPTNDFKGAHVTPIPTGALSSWTPHWRELIRHAAKEANRLDIELCLTVGLACTSGPIDIEYSPQKIVWSETPIKGPQKFDAVLKAPPVGKPHGWNNTYDGKAPLHEIVLLAVPDKANVAPDEAINLSAKMGPDGRLRWDVPAGAWKIQRFCQVSTRARNVWGFYTDAMSAEAMDKTWEVTMAPLLKEMTPGERKGLRAIEDDSWEAGEATWTKRFPEEFQKRRGYDLMPWLPVLAGVKMGKPGEAEGVLRDYRLTIAYLVADNHYGRLSQLAHDNGLKLYSESTGPWPTQHDLLLNCKPVDIVMGEFWVPSPHRPTPERRFMLRNAASANHVYGKPITMCEGFTSVGPFWEDTFFGMKATGDQAFCDGLNRVAFHVYSHSPSLTAKPGFVYFAGTHYNRNVTWWEQTPAFNAYVARCSYLLQQGKFVADAAFYHGDGIGQLEQKKAIPPTLGEGYDHDNCNSDVILNRMSVKDSRIVLPDGMSYRVLVLPENQPMPPAVLEKLAAMVEAGATIVGPPPAGFAGLVLKPEDKAKFDALAARLWGKPDGKTATETRVGLGRVVWGKTVREVLQVMGAAPDFEQSGLSDAGTMDWIHRSTGDAEIYFIASRWEPEEKVTCTFRVADRQPELWDPVTGEIRDAKAFRQEKGRTIVPLEFAPCGSVFVVFRKPIAADANGTATSNYPALALRKKIEGAWDVSFDPRWGGPAKVTFDALTDWTKRPESGIRFYSGTAVYRKKFDLDAAPAKGERLVLDLGTVHEVAAVKLNGVDLGVVWTRPARVDITRAAKAAGNELEITIVNLWPNRIIGDESLPPEKRFTETNMHKFNARTPLYPSGLLGPVKVLAGAEEK